MDYASNHLVTLGVVFFLSLFPLLFAFISRIQRTKMQSERDTVLTELSELKQKYAPVTDAEAEAASILADANKVREEADSFAKQTEESRVSILDNAKIQAENTASSIIEKADSIKKSAQMLAQRVTSTKDGIIAEAKEEAKVIRLKAKDFADKTEKKRELIVSVANEQATSLVATAREEAQRIAGDALEAKEKADVLQAAITAMRNQIKGYRDDYIIPNHTAIDELAEDFGHKDAGEKLKEVRQKIKMLVKEHQAATCDYVEVSRQTTAIHFVLDAFNGKVDSAMSKVKHDNFGKLEQEIKDAFSLVNNNGAAFRNARIERVYLNTRLEELRWAVAVNELKLQEREEQKAIREQMREEERARREMEKAIKEAEKEERMLAKALKAARAELEAAHDDKKAEYEYKLAELQSKLSEAEERGQRAISMAEQTRRGHVYVISNIGSFGENIFKIGMTRRLEPMDRVKELGDASVPFGFDVHAMIFSEDAPTLEKELHRHFQQDAVNKVNPRKEFFGVSLPLIRQKIEQIGVDDIHWTMKAEAVEYRESLAISREAEEAIV
ncbi:DUF4041 domain-containing protein [Bacterioplanoides sp.]|uniref:DUF4041 domain-containing protein n=1 Tax=Bacterioplanoides sp. TaxID=2066072 RepID=UPI003B5CC2D0